MMADTASPLLSGNTWSRAREKQVKATRVQCAKEMHTLLWEHIDRVPKLPRFGNRVRKDILEERASELGIPKTSEGAGRGEVFPIRDEQPTRHRALTLVPGTGLALCTHLPM